MTKLQERSRSALDGLTPRPWGCKQLPRLSARITILQQLGRYTRRQGRGGGRVNVTGGPVPRCSWRSLRYVFKALRNRVRDN